MAVSKYTAEERERIRRSVGVSRGGLIGYFMRDEVGYEPVTEPAVTKSRIRLGLLAFLGITALGVACQSVYTLRSGDVGALPWFVGALSLTSMDMPPVFALMIVALSPILCAGYGLGPASFFVMCKRLRLAGFFGAFTVYSFGEAIGNHLGMYLLYKKVLAGQIDNSFFESGRSDPVELAADSSMFGSPWPVGAGLTMVAVVLIWQHVMMRTGNLKLYVFTAGVAGVILAGRVIYTGHLLALVLIPVVLVLAFLIFPFEMISTFDMVEYEFSKDVTVGVSFFLFYELGAIFTLSALIAY
ncbi:MAG: hypothetical protein E6700_10430 [Winkia neuii]|nr:hypothetical protein [Winkia neuii]MDK8100754.1 hypothetical protein [Winkia neuii]MDU3135961.1 hypothetical protein [Winkia neuii]